MAVSSGILVKIILMVFLSRPEAFQWLELDKKFTVFLFFRLEKHLYDRKVSIIRVINSGLILSSSVGALHIFYRRIDDYKKHADKIPERNHILIIDDPHSLPVTGKISTYLLICRIVS